MLIVGVAELVGTATAATACGVRCRGGRGRAPAGDGGHERRRAADDVACSVASSRAGVRLQEFTGVPQGG